MKKKEVLLYFLIITFYQTIVYGQECKMREEAVEELGRYLFCKSSPSQSRSGDWLKDPYFRVNEEKMKEFCDESISYKAIIAKAGGGTAYSVASEYFINRTLVNQAIPLITDAMVDDFMKKSGMSEKALSSYIRMMDSGHTQAEKMKIAKEVLRRDLARLVVKNAGYYSGLNAGKDLADMARISTDKVVSVIQKSGLGDDITQSVLFSDYGGSAQKALNAAEKEAVKNAKIYINGQEFKQSLAATTSGFKKGLGKWAVPLQVPLRALAGPVGVALSLSLPVILSTLDCPGMPNDVVERDSDNECRAVKALSPKTLKGVLDPKGTVQMMDKHKDICEAYTALYRNYILGIPDNGYRTRCSTEEKEITWDITSSVSGYKIKENVSGVHGISTYYRNRSAWGELEVVNNVNDRAITRELNKYCHGDASNLLDPPFSTTVNAKDHKSLQNK